MFHTEIPEISNTLMVRKKNILAVSNKPENTHSDPRNTLGRAKYSTPRYLPKKTLEDVPQETWTRTLMMALFCHKQTLEIAQITLTREQVNNLIYSTHTVKYRS